MKNILRNFHHSGLLFVIFSLLTGVHLVYAQWAKTNGPYGGRIRRFAVSGTNVFTSADGGGVFLSTDNGATWTQLDARLTDLNVSSLVVSGTNHFAGTNAGGVYFYRLQAAKCTESKKLLLLK